MKRTVEVEVRPTAYPSAFLVAARIAQRRNPGWQAGTPIVETDRPGPQGGRIYEVELTPRTPLVADSYRHHVIESRGLCICNPDAYSDTEMLEIRRLCIEETYSFALTQPPIQDQP